MRSRWAEWVPVARWELQRMLLRVDFVIWTLAMPALMVAGGMFGGWLHVRDARQVREVAVVRYEESGAVSGDSLPALAGFRWRMPRGAAASVESLTAAVRSGRLEGAVLLPTGYAYGSQVEFIVRRERPSWRPRVQRHIATLASLERAAERSVTPDEFVACTDSLVTLERVAAPHSGTSRADRLVAILMATTLFAAVFMTNMYLAMGISGEKQARATEVIVSAISPQSWIDGKIVAYTIIGLAQPVLWTIGGLIAAISLSMQLPPAVNPWALGVFLLYFTLGFAFFVALFAMVMATVKDLQSTTKLQAYLIFLPLLPLMFLTRVIDHPEAPWVVALSQVPVFSPTLIPIRVAIGAAQPWEVVLGLVLLAISAWYMRKAAGTAFRVGMLMYGKELTLPELVRWSREV